MAYSPDSFVADEQPTTAKWNKLWSNDASFNDGSGIGDDTIDSRHYVAGSIDFEHFGTDIGSFQVLADVTLGSAGDTISSGTFTAKKFLRIYSIYQSSGGNADCNIRFNNDSGSNYAVVFAALSAATTTSTSQTSLIVTGATTITNQFLFGDINNAAAAREKAIWYTRCETSTAGAGNAPNISNFMGKWANTSAQITRIDLLNLAGAGDFATGSRLVVLGKD